MPNTGSIRQGSRNLRRNCGSISLCEIWIEFPRSIRSRHGGVSAVLQHVEAVSEVAKLGNPGSHYVSAVVLLRSAFEIALTAYWLVIEDDWKEREARYLARAKKNIKGSLPRTCAI
jgi:hypothetical protein